MDQSSDISRGNVRLMNPKKRSRMERGRGELSDGMCHWAA